MALPVVHRREALMRQLIGGAECTQVRSLFTAWVRSYWLAGRGTLLCEGSRTLCSRCCQRAKEATKVSSGCASVQLSLVVERQCHTAVAIPVNPNLVRPAINTMKYTSSDHSICGSDMTSLSSSRLRQIQVLSQLHYESATYFQNAPLRNKRSRAAPR
jgi:hypothetical protein